MALRRCLNGIAGGIDGRMAEMAEARFSMSIKRPTMYWPAATALMGPVRM